MWGAFLSEVRRRSIWLGATTREGAVEGEVTTPEKLLLAGAVVSGGGWRMGGCRAVDSGYPRNETHLMGRLEGHEVFVV